MILFLISLPILIQQTTSSESPYYSPWGAYNVQWKEFGPCPPEKRGTDEIFTDVRLTMRRQGVTKIIGKYIFRTPFDDNITINISLAALGTDSVWLQNVYNVAIPSACSSMMNFLQDGWREYLKSMGMIPKCPFAKGVYELKGYNVNNVLGSSRLPKEFFYGTYKVTFDYLRIKELIGCSYAIVQIVPRWQSGSK